MHSHRKRILCVDDEQDTCAMLSSLLDLINCEVVTAGSMSEAWHYISSERFDLYLLENWVPGGSGIDLCQKIREIEAQAPIVFYSAAAYDSDRQQALSAGAQVYLVKPSDIDKLVKTVRNLLDRKESLI